MAHPHHHLSNEDIIYVIKPKTDYFKILEKEIKGFTQITELKTLGSSGIGSKNEKPKGFKPDIEIISPKSQDITLYFHIPEFNRFLMIKDSSNGIYNKILKKGINTNDQTFLKENISKIYFSNKNANLKLVVDNTLEKLVNDIRQEYLDSAKKQRKALEKKYQLSQYNFYLQNEPIPKLIYKKIKGIKKDNWNPSDIWGFHKNFSLNELKKDLKNIEDNNFSKLNQYIKDKIDQKQIIPISLKHINKGKEAKLEFKEVKKTENIDVSIKVLSVEIGVKDSNLYLEIRTAKSNSPERYQIRFGKSKSTSVNLETREVNEYLKRYTNHALGAFNKEQFRDLSKHYNKQELTLKEYQDIIKSLYDKTPKNLFFLKYNLNRLPDKYDIKDSAEFYYRILKLDPITKARHFVTLQTIEYFLKLLENKQNQLLAYKLIHKISDTSSPYFLLS